MKPTLNTDIPANHQTGDQWDKVAYNKEHGKEYRENQMHCDCCNHMINLARKARHYKSKKHIKNALAVDRTNEIHQYMITIHDKNILVLERMNHTLAEWGELLRDQYLSIY